MQKIAAGRDPGEITATKLSELIAVIGITNKEKNEQVKYLINQKFSNSDIARLIGLPIGTVSSIRNGLNKKKKKTKEDEIL
jgi:hypothetical protein